MSVRFHACLGTFSLLIAACSGDGCGGMQPIPGGFPQAARVPNAAQLRISQTGLASLEADPAALVGALLGGPLTFEVPASCDGDPAICCPDGVPVSPCGPIEIDLVAQAGDEPRLVLDPVSGAQRLDITMRARVRSLEDIPVEVPVVGDCGLRVDTTANAPRDLRVDLSLAFTQDAALGTTRIAAQNVTVTQFDEDDVELTGGFACEVASFGLGFVVDTVTDTFASTISDSINEQTCKTCPGGDVGECGGIAAACTDNVCVDGGGTCVQELGLTGRLRDAFGDLSPGTLGAIDVYEVAGGYATTETNGLALGFLGGMLPAGAVRDRCGPPATAPAPVSIPASAYFSGNTRPDTSAPFDVAIGLHESQLDAFAYAAYDGGLLCLTVGSSSSPLINSMNLGLFVPSLVDLAPREPAAMAIGLRPQAPPTIALGANTFRDEGGMQVVDEPLLDVTFTGLELDFFMAVEQQYVRVFTAVTDLRLPIGMQVTAGGSLEPILGDLDNAFTNLSVKNAEAVRETPEEIARVLPQLLDLALPQLAGSLGTFDLPALGNLTLQVDSVAAVDANQFLAIYARLVPAPAARQVPRAEAVIDDVTLEAGDVPALRLRMRATDETAMWSFRVDGGTWSAWTDRHEVRLPAPSLVWRGRHLIEARARLGLDPASEDLTPATMMLDDSPTTSVPETPQAFHGQGSGSGCGCASGDRSTGWPIALAIAMVLGGWRRKAGTWLRRLRAHRRQLAAVALAGLMPSCDCGSENPCGDVECLPGELAPGSTGRHNAIASDGTRTVVTTYDERWGDLVLVDVAADGTRTLRSLAGVPDVTPVHEPDTYRGGVDQNGPNVGHWTSVALRGGRALASFYDLDARALGFSQETEDGVREVVVDAPVGGESLGAYSSLSLTADGGVAIAYQASGVASGAGFVSQLRMASAPSAEPNVSDWTVAILASAPQSCAGLCANGTTCAEPATDAEPEACVVDTGDCAGACGDDEVCVAAACRAVIEAPPYAVLPAGVGMFANLVTLADGRRVVISYDLTRASLVAHVEAGAGSATFAETVLDGGEGLDRGYWASAVTDGTTIHIAYQDARGDQLVYTSWAGTPGTPLIVDDGVRDGDRPHPVGAGASIYLTSGAPAIAYQDGQTADILVATQASGWARTGVSTGITLDGFHLAATTGWIAWDAFDRSREPIADLAILPAP